MSQDKTVKTQVKHLGTQGWNTRQGDGSLVWLRSNG